MACETGVWFWKYNDTKDISSITSRDTKDFTSDSVTEEITRVVNGGKKKLKERQEAKRLIGKEFVKRFGACK